MIDKKRMTKYPLLKRCLNSGGVTGLFPLLSKWPKPKIGQLMDELDAFYAMADKKITADWEAAAMELVNVFSPRHTHQLDRHTEDQRFELLALTSEIYSGALYYAPELRPKESE